MDLPRILVVSHNPFSRSHNNGRTMSALFDGWPADSIAQIYIPFMTRLAPSTDVCQKYWPITPKGMLQDLTRPRNRSLVLDEAKPEIQAPDAVASVSRLRGLGQSKRILRLAEPLREVFYALPSATSSELIAWSKAHRPDVIFSMLGSIHCIDITVRLSKVLDVPVVPYFSDDWAATLHENAYFSGVLRKRLNRSLQRVLERSPVRTAVGPGLAAEYTRRYGGDFIPAPNYAEPESYAPAPRERAPDEPFRLVYMGGLHLERWTTLRVIGEALEQLASTGIHGVLDIYCPERDREAHGAQLQLSSIALHGFAPPSEIPRILHGSDIVCLVEGFDEYFARYARFSFSTKIPEYAMAGRPIFAVGPADQTSLQGIQESGAGVHVTEPTQAVIAEKLRSLLADPIALTAMGATSREIAIREYSRTAVQERFKAAIRQAVEMGVPKPS